MKTKKYISIKFRKAIAISLLFYFILTPLLFAIPQEKCSGSCPMAIEMENCKMQMNDMEDSCCDMSMSESASTVRTQDLCNMEITVNSCMIEKYFNSSNIFVVMQKYQSANTLSIIFIIDHFTNNNNFKNHVNINSLINDESPPIYITIQSFLI